MIKYVGLKKLLAYKIIALAYKIIALNGEDSNLKCIKRTSLTNIEGLKNY